MTFSTNNQDVLIVPHGPLTASQLYTLHLEGVEDLTGNPVTVQTTSFTTGGSPDLTAPVVLQRTPTSGATNVPVNTVVSVEFSEAIDRSLVDETRFTLRDNTTGLLVAGTRSVSGDGQTVTFVPTAPLAVNRSHSVSVQVWDLANNSGSTSLSFTTGSVNDTIGPQIVASSPDRKSERRTDERAHLGAVRRADPRGRR